MSKPLQPKTGLPCSCKRGQHRDNCPQCEGTGWQIDFRAIHARRLQPATVKEIANWVAEGKP